MTRAICHVSPCRDIHSTLLDTEAYLLTCMRYIGLNPVRAQIFSHPHTTRSSYRSNSSEKQDRLITLHPLFL
jgi:putative transposase